MTSQKLKNYFLLHFIILLWGFTPVLGKLISFQALDLVWWRLLFAGSSLYIYLRYKGDSLKLDLKNVLFLLGWGVVVGLHWFCFYHAIKVSNVSMAMAGFSTITLFASIVQPLILKRKFFWGDVFYGGIIIAALVIILQFESVYYLGVIFGALAALTGAMFGVYNGKLITKHPAGKITFYEFLGAFITITLIQIVQGNFKDIPIPSGTDLWALLILSLACTTLAFTLSVEILKQIDPLTVIITNNLELVYGVVFSLWLFGSSELMSQGFYYGAIILLVAVFTYPLFKRKFYKE
jgi:drug/metabolite transporter (DMT)-like permease